MDHVSVSALQIPLFRFRRRAAGPKTISEILNINRGRNTYPLGGRHSTQSCRRLCASIYSVERTHGNCSFVDFLGEFDRQHAAGCAFLTLVIHLWLKYFSPRVVERCFVQMNSLQVVEELTPDSSSGNLHRN